MVVVVKDNDIQIERLELKPWGTNAYIIICLQTRDSVLIDAPADASTIIKRLEGTNPKYILLTHNHVDHIGVLFELRSKLKVPLAAHAADSARLPSPPDILLNDGDLVSLGKVKLEVLHTPGHTSGSLCFKIGRCLISGDTIFPGGPGKTKSPADLRQIIKSITDKILVLSDDTAIYPGHGDSTTLKKERNEFAIFSSRPHDLNLCGDVLWLSS
ncbi:MAG TPA: MBL fold metallo-hydrolase [Dehalococcoidia bacterium]|jgi:glyoxylase-like metal-dependent hydrolase (beta-lactamase superfamily II)|nr:MBL fold metallo-hydrolase [Dehalococcoidia bacterium]